MKRYDIDSYWRMDSNPKMTESPTGLWVRYEDVDELESTIETLRDDRDVILCRYEKLVIDVAQAINSNSTDILRGKNYELVQFSVEMEEALKVVE